MRTKVYTNDENCTYCQMLKFLMDKAKIEFEYLVVSQDEIKSMGVKYVTTSMPIVIFDEFVVFGDPSTIVEHIKKELK